MNSRKIILFLAVSLGAGLYSSEAQARKKGPLEGEPIVRNKLQLRRLRFQLTPFVGMSLSQPYVHKGYVGAKATFHFADWIGARGTFGWGVLGLESQLLRAINDGGLPAGVEPGESIGANQTCGDINPDRSTNCRPLVEEQNPAPLRHDFRAGLVQAQWQASVDAVFTPFAGKLGLFSAIFTEYDIYIFGGLGIVGYQRQYPDEESTAEDLGLDTDPDSMNYCRQQNGEGNAECLLHPVNPDTGPKFGGSFGGGINLFITDWVSINLEFQDIVTAVNLAGLNATIEDIPPRVNSDDRDVFHNVTFQLGARFYFPPKAKRTK